MEQGIRGWLVRRVRFGVDPGRVMMRVYLAVEEYYARRRRLTERRLGERDVIGAVCRTWAAAR
jgi:hypothetical protein